MADPSLAVATVDSDDDDDNNNNEADDENIAMGEAVNPEEEEDGEDDEENDDDEEEEEIPWRLRQAADKILEGRPTVNATKAHWKRFTAPTSPQLQVRHGNWAVQQAFEFAASSILNAMRNSDQIESEDEDDNDDDEDWKNDLPQQKPSSADRLAVLQQVWETNHSSNNGTSSTNTNSNNNNNVGSKKEHNQQQQQQPSTKKFSRNTPASSASSLDSRLQGSRIMLCGAGNWAISHLTPGPDIRSNILQDVQSSSSSTMNWGALTLEAQTAGERAVAVALNAVRRARQRYEYRRRSVVEVKDAWKLASLRRVLASAKNTTLSNQLDASTNDAQPDNNQDSDDDDIPMEYSYNPDDAAVTHMWQSVARPRFLKILGTGTGHAIYHDVQWSTRHGRVTDLLQHFSAAESSYGPHLILTTQPDVMQFANQFRRHYWWEASDEDANAPDLYVLPYHGTPKERQALRRDFSHANGLANSSFHVLVTSYKMFFADYVHFTALPWDVVVVDDGLAWLAAGRDADLGKIFDDGLFSTADHHIGLAGTMHSSPGWDFTAADQPDAPLVGLTAKHRILTASGFHQFRPMRATNEFVPVAALLEFLVPQFVATVREEWDRSKIATDTNSMNHFRKLVARSIVVHHEDDATDTEENTLVLQALTGKLASVDRVNDPAVPHVVPDDDFVGAKKIQFSRRTALQWLGTSPNHSWLRYELGIADFTPILELMKSATDPRLTCEEIATASSTTSSGATGQIAGSMAFRLAVRCGRHFVSEPGLRQHVNAHHAPLGTWLCRSCAVDCLTSQARTHHERSCGIPTAVDAAGVGATPTVGQGGTKKQNKKKTKTAPKVEVEKDADGSIKVPGYRGVWVNKSGKHFVKVDGTDRFTDDKGKLVFFDTADEAAKKYDELTKVKLEGDAKAELNFKEDGSRIVYEDITPMSTSGLGGSASHVVPALSKINIKVRDNFLRCERLCLNDCILVAEHRICPKMSSHCYVIRAKPHVPEAIARDTFMPSKWCEKQLNS